MNSNSGQDREIADTKFKLANVWQLKGNFARALAGYQEVLKIQSNYFPAYVQLGHLMCRQKNLAEAAAYYDRALEINFAEVDLAYYYQVLGLSYHRAIAEDKSDRQIEDNVRGKINLNQQKGFDFHRHGWGLALDTLQPLHNSQGIRFNGCLEDTFLYQQNLAVPRSQRLITKMKEDGVFKYLGTLVEKEIVPYTKPWVGFIHNPPYVADWFKNRANPSDMFEQPVWQESLKHCLGIFCLSQYQTAWLKKKVNVPVVNLIHPTAISELQFSFNSFVSNSQKKIVQVGWWLRKLNSIEQLPIAQGNQLGYIKVRLVPKFAQNADEQLEQIMLAEREINGLEILPEYAQNTIKIQHLVNAEYDRLLAENIVLIDLYDAGANTAILDCLARATPVLVNPLPAVQEYLGTEYPFYFRDLSEAAAKAMDLDLIKASHLYLQKWQLRTEFSATHFLSSFKQSVIYKSI